MNILLEETIHELGFRTLEDFLTIKVMEELEKKIKKYEEQVAKYEKQYKMSFPDFNKQYLSTSQEDFEKDDDGAEWDWNIFAIESTKKKLESLIHWKSRYMMYYKKYKVEYSLLT